MNIYFSSIIVHGEVENVYFLIMEEWYVLSVYCSKIILYNNEHIFFFYRYPWIMYVFL